MCSTNRAKNSIGGREGWFPQKKKVCAQNREEEKEERWNFPVTKGRYRIFALVSAGISRIGFVKGQYRISPLVSAGISRIFLFGPIYLDFPYIV